MTMDLVSIVNGPNILGGMSDQGLSGRVRDRVESAYGGNQAAFAKAVGMSPQSVSALLRGKVALPMTDTRRRLARELRISHIDLLVLAGELDKGEVREAGVEGVVEEGPVHHLQKVVSKYDWEWEEAARLADMIEAYAKPRDPSMTNQRDT